MNELEKERVYVYERDRVREREKDTHPVPVNLLEPEPDHVEGEACGDRELNDGPAQVRREEAVTILYITI